MWSGQRGSRCQLEGGERSFSSLHEAGCPGCRREQHVRWPPSPLPWQNTHLCWLLFSWLRLPTKQVEGGLLCWTHSFLDTIYHEGKSMRNLVPLHLQAGSRKRNGVAQLTLSFVSNQDPSPWEEGVTFKVCLPFSVNSQKLPHRHAQVLVFQVILGPIKLTTNIFPAEHPKPKLPMGSTLEYLWITLMGHSPWVGALDIFCFYKLTLNIIT